MDGAWDISTKDEGIGYLIRNTRGTCLQAVAVYTQAFSALCMEMLAIRSGLQHLCSCQHTLVGIVIEIDYKVVIKLMRDEDNDLESQVLNSKKEINFLISRFNNVILDLFLR